LLFRSEVPNLNFAEAPRRTTHGYELAAVGREGDRVNTVGTPEQTCFDLRAIRLVKQNFAIPADGQQFAVWRIRGGGQHGRLVVGRRLGRNLRPAG
jgi:hypothetical protein